MKRVAVATMVACTLLLAGCGGHHAPLHGGRAHSARFVYQAETSKFSASQFSLTPNLAGYDAVTVSAIPHGALVVGCYVSGSFANCGTAHADFPRARLVTIATWAGAPAKILDTEPGDAVPSQDAGWIRWMLSRGEYRPGIYADASEMVQVRADLAAAGIARSSYVLWVAAWDGNPAIPTGFDAKQWRSAPNVDYDTFATSFFAAAPRPGPTPAQITHWRQARNSSFTAYHRAGCKLALKGECGLLGYRIRYFQGKLWTVAARWACFGKHARTRTAICWIVRPVANYWSHAARASQDAFQRNVCGGASGTQGLTRLCKVLQQRQRWFHRHATALVKAYG